MPSHIDPAKFAYLLIERIYDHARAEGWLPPGTRVLDPFAGVALGAIHALRLGCSWTGVELEPKFFAIGRSNLAKWMHEYRHLPGWGPWAMVVNGDSRKLLEHVPTQTGCIVSSPPYASTPIAACEGNMGGGPGGRKASALTDVNGNIKHVGYGSTEGNLADMAVSSPPWTNQEPSHAQRSSPSRDRLRAEPPATRGQRFLDATYGSSPGQLANMPADLAVSSPPYVDSVNAEQHGIDWTEAGPATGKRKRGKGTKHEATLRAQMAYGQEPGQMGAMPAGDLVVSSPPYAATDTKPHALGTGKGTRATGASADRNKGDYHYGETPGNLAALSVSSPPYSTSTQVNNHPQDMTAGKARWAGGTDSAARVKQDYVEPETPGNLSHMPALAVSSPPYADGCGQQGHDYHPERMVGTRTGYIQRDHAGYGESHGQLATEEATTFWSAARTVVAQTFALLRPGGHAIWVVKAYVREKKIVDFPAQWQAMCESVGFVTLHEHHAMLVEDHGTQTGLFGEDTVHTTERKSFFRRLAEKKGSPRIDYECVLCMVKPAGDGTGIDTCVSSPPYSVGLGKEHTYADHTKRDRDSHRRIMTEKHIADPFYGTTEGNLGNLPDDAPTKSRKRPRKPRVVQETVPAPEDSHG